MQLSKRIYIISGILLCGVILLIITLVILQHTGINKAQTNYLVTTTPTNNGTISDSIVKSTVLGEDNTQADFANSSGHYPIIVGYDYSIVVSLTNNTNALQTITPQDISLKDSQGGIYSSAFLNSGLGNLSPGAHTTLSLTYTILQSAGTSFTLVLSNHPFAHSTLPVTFTK